MMRVATRSVSQVVLAACMTSLAWLPGDAAADEIGTIVVRSAQTRLVGEVYRLDAEIEFDLGAEVEEALRNGVPLTIDVELEILRQRPWIWDASIAKLRLRRVLQYHALSQQYLVNDLQSGQQRSLPTLNASLVTLGRVRDLPILNKRLLKAGAFYRGRARARLDIESLPAPLRPTAYLTPAWRLVSEWFVWLLKS